MATYPPRTWEIRPLEDMSTMEGSPQTDDTFGVQILLAVPPAAGEEGSYKFLVSGRDHLTVEVPVNTIIKDPRFQGLAIHAQFQPGTQVIIDRNSSCSPWMDVVELVRSQDVDIVDSTGKLAGDRFIELIQEYQNARPAIQAGISLRWVLGLKDSPKDIYLLLQALPCSLDAIEVTVN